MTKPTVFNYQDYVALEAQVADLREENDRLREKVANLEIRCRIAEEALTEMDEPVSDLISRQDAINEIKNVFDDVLCCNVSVRKGLPEAVKRIKMMSSADAVEVIRCKDCKYWCPHTQCGFDEDKDEYHDYCGLLIPDDDFYAYTRKPNDYCSRGERREEVKS